MTFLRIVIPLYLFFQHDLFGKPVPTFPDHALPLLAMTGSNVGFKFQTVRGYAFVFSRRDAPEVCINFTLLQNGGCRESRMPIAPAVVRTKSARVDHRFNRITPAFPARWFTAYFVLSPVNGLSCHRRRTDTSARLDASIAAPEPHDFAVRFSRARQSQPWRPPHPN